MLSNLGYRNVYGVVTAPNEASEFLHAKFGFKSAGTWLNVGYKNGKWLSVNVFEKQINLYTQEPMGTKCFNKLTQEETADFLQKAQLLLK